MDFFLSSPATLNSSLWETASPLLSSHIASLPLYWVPSQGLDFGSTCDGAIQMICGLLLRVAAVMSECYPTIRSALFTAWKWVILTQNPGAVTGLMRVNRWRRGIWLGSRDLLCWSKWASELLWTFQIGFEVGMHCFSPISSGGMPLYVGLPEPIRIKRCSETMFEPGHASSHERQAAAYGARGKVGAEVLRVVVCKCIRPWCVFRNILTETMLQPNLSRRGSGLSKQQAMRVS